MSVARPPQRLRGRKPRQIRAGDGGAALSFAVLFVLSFGLPYVVVFLPTAELRWLAVGVGFVLFLSTIGVYISRAHVADARRIKTMEWAADRGWAYAKSVPELSDLWARNPFGRSEIRGLFDVASGSIDGRFAAVGDYVFSRSGDVDALSSTIHVAFVTLERRVHAVDFTPKDAVENVELAFGGTEIPIESAAFNQRWRVRGDDERTAHAIAHPRLAERLMEADAQGLNVRVEGESVMVWNPHRRGVEDWDDMLLLAADVASLIPSHILKDSDEAASATVTRSRTPSERSIKPALTARDILYRLVVVFLGLGGLGMFMYGFAAATFDGPSFTMSGFWANVIVNGWLVAFMGGGLLVLTLEGREEKRWADRQAKADGGSAEFRKRSVA